MHSKVEANVFWVRVADVEACGEYHADLMLGTVAWPCHHSLVVRFHLFVSGKADDLRDVHDIL